MARPIEPFAYLDHNATTPVRARAAAAVTEAMGVVGNASSVHAAGREARRRLAAARAVVGQAVGLPSGGQIVFTSGGTEANHLALRGTGLRVIRSAIEHDSVRAAAPDALEVPALADGTVDLAALARILADLSGPVLVSAMAANNETGVVQPVAEVVRLAHAAGAIVHCDAVQAICKIPFDVAALGLDLVTVSAHKLGGPQGAGALAIGPGVTVEAVQRGGGQERGMRAGTENLPGIAGFAAAIEEAVAEVGEYAALARMRDDLERRLVAAEPAAVIFGRARARLPNTCCIALPGVGAETQVIALDLAGVGVSAGAACSSGKLRPSHVLEAMGATPDLVRSAIRISIGATTRPEHIDRLVAAWTALAARCAAQRSAA